MCACVCVTICSWFSPKHLGPESGNHYKSKCFLSSVTKLRSSLAKRAPIWNSPVRFLCWVINTGPKWKGENGEWNQATPEHVTSCQDHFWATCVCFHWLLNRTRRLMHFPPLQRTHGSLLSPARPSAQVVWKGEVLGRQPRAWLQHWPVLATVPPGSRKSVIPVLPILALLGPASSQLGGGAQGERAISTWLQ